MELFGSDTVAANIWYVWLLQIRPPIIAFGKIIVRAARMRELWKDAIVTGGLLRNFCTCLMTRVRSIA